MEHRDHVALLAAGVTQPDGVWADLGAGDGAFTLALADLLGPGATIYAVDRDERALARLARSLAARFPRTTLHTIAGDFTRPLDLPRLDGMIMANSLHYIPDKDKEPVLRRLRGYLQPGSPLIVVEYNTDRGNRWVPHPFSFATWQKLSEAAGFETTKLLATRPSSFLGEFFSAASR
jgi:SAM-dependent methyltransferase